MKGRSVCTAVPDIWSTASGINEAGSLSKGGEIETVAIRAQSVKVYQVNEPSISSGIPTSKRFSRRDLSNQSTFLKAGMQESEGNRPVGLVKRNFK